MIYRTFSLTSHNLNILSDYFSRPKPLKMTQFLPSLVTVLFLKSGHHFYFPPKCVHFAAIIFLTVPWHIPPSMSYNVLVTFQTLIDSFNRLHQALFFKRQTCQSACGIVNIDICTSYHYKNQSFTTLESPIYTSHDKKS